MLREETPKKSISTDGYAKRTLIPDTFLRSVYGLICFHLGSHVKRWQGLRRGFRWHFQSGGQTIRRWFRWHFQRAGQTPNQASEKGKGKARLSGNFLRKSDVTVCHTYHFEETKLRPIDWVAVGSRFLVGHLTQGSAAVLRQTSTQPSQWLSDLHAGRVVDSRGVLRRQTRRVAVDFKEGKDVLEIARRGSEERTRWLSPACLKSNKNYL